ncbi:hypothetical protein BDQ12DRAFT_176516 [Crucibulum laeve]|uniref:DNA replication factor Cdt1 C-terminal domain-containing protein n=1 Tax=Crucibulum laeve TaxID=68775 RepID=A0A5C3MEP6_9AGAR|nr:hypothetical protein BDQ12DRAFT_176516 [Crucibulum laeve]
MSDLYTSLQVSPRKKRTPPEFDNDTFTPKKLRTAPPTPPASSSRRGKVQTALKPLPTHLSRLCAIQTAIQHAISHALATCAISPTSDSGLVRNVLNHLSLTTYAGLNTNFQVDDLKRLCWIWEWDGKSLPKQKGIPKPVEDEDNPFLDASSAPQSSSGEWTRGSMGLVLSPTTHYSKTDRKRVPAYGLGIEVEMDLDKDMGGGMAAVARWTATADTRRAAFRAKLDRWIDLHSAGTPIAPIPLADLPQLETSSRISSLTRTLASCSPRGASLTPPGPPSSPSRSPSKSPTKGVIRGFAVPFPIASSSSKSPTKSGSLLFPQTPSRHGRDADAALLCTPQTPSLLTASPAKSIEPSTPTHQRGRDASTAPQTPSTSRRQALYERVRLRSLTASPTKGNNGEHAVGSLSRDQMQKMGQDEMRRRCLLGRLGGVAESVWMLFSTPATGSSTTPTSRKRRALPMPDVAAAIIKSSPVPISVAEANESLTLLTKLCPFFLKPLTIAGADWLEMPAAKPAVIGDGDATPTKRGLLVPSSPGAVRGKEQSAQELVTRSPKRVKKEIGGLREVREIIRKELELQD